MMIDVNSVSVSRKNCGKSTRRSIDGKVFFAVEKMHDEYSMMCWRIVVENFEKMF